jgi:nucleoside-diphosphate-sugar epimerase
MLDINKGPILITGGGGFLGKAIAQLLCNSNLEVRSLSRQFYPEIDQLGIQQIQADLSDYNTVGDAFEDCQLVFHVAAKAGIWGDPSDFYNSNVIGTRNVIKGCLENGVRRLVYTSSPSVVFDGQDMEGADESVPYGSRFTAHYPATKATAEKEVLSQNGSLLATVALRPHLIWGPDDPHIIPGLIRRARQGQLRRIGNENKLVDFTYIQNAAHAHLLAAKNLNSNSPIAGKAYFITDDQPEPLWDFVNKLLEAGGLPPIRKRVNRKVAYLAASILETLHRFSNRSGEPRITRFLVEELATSHWFDISAAKQDLGYSPIISRQEGLSQVKKWLKEKS